MVFNCIPEQSLIETAIPIERISDLSKKEGNSKKPIYTIHKWWARRLSTVVRALIMGILLPSDSSEDLFWDTYYQSNDMSSLTVLDPFMGGGTCIVESKKMRARTIGVDIDPLACFVTQKEIQPLDETILEKEFIDTVSSVEKEVSEFFNTRVNGRQAEVVNFFWAYDVVCKKCGKHTIAHPHYYLAKDLKNVTAFCRYCGHVAILPASRKRFKCDNCGKTTDIYKGSFIKGSVKCSSCGEATELALTVKGSDDLKLFAIECVLDGERIYKKADTNDIELYSKAKKLFFQLKDELIITDDLIPVSESGDPRPQSHGYLRLRDLFNYRQLLTLGLLLKQILEIEDKNNREWLLTAFSDCLASNNLLCCYAYDYKKLTPLFSIHAYTVPCRVCENNVLGTDSLGRGTFKKTYRKMIRGKQYAKEVYEVRIDEKGKREKVFTGETIEDDVADSFKLFHSKQYSSLILNQSSENLKEIPDNSIDIVLTDPPYYDNLAYSELSSFFYSWIKQYIGFQCGNVLDKTIYVSCQAEEKIATYIQQLTNVFQQCHNKLKDCGIMVFSFHHNKVDAWISLAQSIRHSAFEVTNVFPIRSEGSSAYHSSEESIKWDSIIVLRKKANNRRITEPSWENEIDYCKDVLKLKKCDFISYYRSLRLQAFVNQEQQLTDSKEIKDFFNRDNESIIEAFEKKGDQ